MKKLVLGLLSLTLVCNCVSAKDAFELKCDDKVKWQMLEEYWQNNRTLNSTEKETMKIKKLHYQKVSEDMYYCWYNLSFVGRKGNKENLERSFTIRKNDGVNGTTIDFQTKKYKLIH